MLFLFLRFAFLEYFLFTLVWASPMKKSLRVAEEPSLTSDTGSSTRGNHVRVHPYQKQQGQAASTFRCPNGQLINKNIVIYSVAQLCHKIVSQSQEGNIKIIKITSGPKYDSWIHPINADGTLVFQSGYKDPLTEYEIIVHQDKRSPLKCHLGPVFFKSGAHKHSCLLGENPVNSSKQVNKVMDCDGVIFRPDQVYTSMHTASKILFDRLTRLQLSTDPKTDNGYPRPFKDQIFPHEDTWMYPIIPGVDPIYKNGDPGRYSVIITGKGKAVGVVYLKTQEQLLQDTIKGLLVKEAETSRYGVCRTKSSISID